MENALMEDMSKAYPFRCTLSFKHLLDYLEAHPDLMNGSLSCSGFSVKQILAEVPALGAPIPDLTQIDEYDPWIRRMISLVFPPVFWESEPTAAVIPFSVKPVFVSPEFQRLFLDKNGNFTGRMNLNQKQFFAGRVIRAFLFILNKFYGISQNIDYPVIRIIEDPVTGLERHFQINFDFRFVDVRALKPPKSLSEKEREIITEHLTEPEVLRKYLPPEDFELCGFTLLQATDVTESEMISILGRDMIEQESIISREGFLRLQERLRTYFRRPELVADLSAIHEDQVLLLNSGMEMTRNCIFADSHHVPITEFKGTIYEEAVSTKQIFRVPDVADSEMPDDRKSTFLEQGIRSIMITPLHYKGKAIGMLILGSPKPRDLTPLDALSMSQIQPLFSMAINKALDDLENQIQAVIKEKCTAVHPSVEWRFRRAALHHLDYLRQGNPSEMEPIVFRDVFPLFGTCDVRGSADERNRAVREDLIEHLTLALDLLTVAYESKPLFVLNELVTQIEGRIDRIRAGLQSGDEVSTAAFLREEVESLFDHLHGFGPKMLRAIERYRLAVDPKSGTVYRRRRDFEDSVSVLTSRLAEYLDREEGELQQLFPHYFERHCTDGIDYLIYIGESLMEKKEFNPLYLKNLRLWQLKLSAGFARLSESLKSELKVPLETTQLILVQDTPLSIRFRFDEKRFDVDGAYDIRHEIIKSRIDKAVVKEKDERLTQPGKIAVVYSHPKEGREIRRHIEFLKSEGWLTGSTESLELGDLPGVQGLKALRVEVNL
ncbi:MAG: GAF domain-containing protein, partial [Deltaproteobacteria bacterium]|nr:GAF domain-containing protein [Deltaproteobacteria bacterium]